MRRSPYRPDWLANATIAYVNGPSSSRCVGQSRACRATDRTVDTPAAPTAQGAVAWASPLGDVGWGSGGSLGPLPQDLFLQRQLRHDAFQSGVVLLELFQPFRLGQLQAPVFFPPAGRRLLGNRRLFAGRRRALAGGHGHFHLPQPRHDLLRGRPLLRPVRLLSFQGFSLIPAGIESAGQTRWVFR